MNFCKKYGFICLWIAVTFLALVMYYFYAVNVNFIGVVETRTHKLSAQESGRIQNILVSLGDKVSANQLLVAIDTSDLDTEKAWLQDELKRLEILEEADRSRYTLEYEKLRFQSDADASRLDQWRSELEEKKAELRAIKDQIQHLEHAQKAGLGRTREMSDLIIRRDSLTSYIAKQRAIMYNNEPKYVSQKNYDGQQESERVVESLLSERIERINEIKLRLKIIETRKDRSEVITPCEGRVVNINYMPGDSVEAFQTILTIEEPQAEFIDVYVPETSDRTPILGERVAVYPHRTGKFDSQGTVVFVDPGFSAIPQRLTFRNLVYWARKFRVQLDKNHHLMPGEAAKVKMLGNISPFTSANATEPEQTQSLNDNKSINQKQNAPKPVPIQVPDSLKAMTPIEPSGLAWLPDIKRYLIISDDTGRKTMRHAPWVFLMDDQGQLEAEPIKLKGVDKINDLEAIAILSENEFYFVSSQNLNKKGHRKSSRQFVLKVKRDGRNFTVEDKIELYTLLTKSYSEQQLHELGLGETAQNGELLMNIEGAAWFEGSLLLGLKQPISRNGAIIWRFDDPDSLWKSHILKPNQLSLFATINLRTPKGQASGISDLAVSAEGELVALSTVPNVSSEQQCGGFYQLKRTGADIFEASLKMRFPNVKPEGICLTKNQNYTIVFDADDKTPCYLNVER